MLKIRRFVVNEMSIKLVLSLMFICGWLLPKIKIGGFNLGLQEFAAILMILYRYRIKSYILRIFRADLYFSLFLFGFGIFYFVKIGDLEGILMGVRTMLFVFASLSFSAFSKADLNKLIKRVSTVYLVFVIWSVTRILFNILVNSFDMLNFFYGSDSYRVRSPFENGGASSQVPIGYMLALLLCLPSVAKSRFKKIAFMLGAFGTTSRASILSIAIVYARKIDFRKIGGIISISLLVSLLAYAAYLKSFSMSGGELDGSANKRLELYFNSIGLMFRNPESLLIGFGVSTNVLASATGEGFYESFIVNSLMQGGLFLFIISIWILVKTFYYDFKYRMYSISIVVFFGNAVGGSNYFSMFAYPLMALIISIAMSKIIADDK